MLKRFFSFVLFLGLFQSFEAPARNYIAIGGSSTVYPFASVAAEQFGLETQFKTPVIESLGTGGGFKVFCSGIGLNTPDINNASRRIKAGEIKRCQSNGVHEIIEIKIGYDGVVMAHSLHSFKRQPFSLSFKDIFLALAKAVPATGSETLIPNPYETWKDVNPQLPDHAIQIYGPPPISGTRDFFMEIAMEGGCNAFPWIEKLKKEDKTKYKEICHTVRESGGFFVTVGENDNLIAQKLNTNGNFIGIMGFSFLDGNLDVIKKASLLRGKRLYLRMSWTAPILSPARFIYMSRNNI